MNDKLTDKKEEYIAQKDVCNDGFNENAKDPKSKERSKAKLIFSIKDQQMSQGQLTKVIDTRNANIQVALIASLLCPATGTAMTPVQKVMQILTGMVEK
ncbi:hypothetical protein N9L19_00325 [bacterium]|nr:hypothetical protein [bacterium]